MSILIEPLLTLSNNACFCSSVARLRILEGQHKKNLYALQDKIRKDYPEDIRKQELLLERVTADIASLEQKITA